MITAAGAFLVSKETKRVLYSLRAGTKTHPYTWGVWGGKIEENETVTACLIREILEETGTDVSKSKIIPFDIFESKDKNFRFYTFVVFVEKEFQPVISAESAGYAWVDPQVILKPLHQGVFKSFKSNGFERFKMIIESGV